MIRPDYAKGEYFMPFRAMSEVSGLTREKALEVNRKLAQAGVIEIIRELPHGIIARYLLPDEIARPSQATDKEEQP